LVETLDFISSKLSPRSVENKFLIQSDCLMLVESVLSSTPSSWAVQPLVDRAKLKMASLSGISLAHCNRATNKVADWLAKFHRWGCLPRNWITNPPYALLDLLCTDTLDVRVPNFC